MSQTPPVAALNRVSGFLVIVRWRARDLTFGGWRLKNGTGGIKRRPRTQGQHRQRGRPRGRWTVSFNMTEPGSTRISTGMQPLARATGAGSRRERSYEAQIHPSDTSHRHAQVYSYIPQSTAKILFCYLRIHVSSNSAIGCSQVHPYPVWKNYRT